MTISMSVIGIVIESGAIYVILMIPMVILFACNYFAKLIPFNILGQVMVSTRWLTIPIWI